MVNRNLYRERGCDDFIKTLSEQSSSLQLWRGYGNCNWKEVVKQGPIAGRQPKNNSQLAHSVSDNWFHDKFGIRFRSQSMFCTGDRKIAAHYGNVYSILPFDGYQFCWSPKIRDLYSEISLSFMKKEDADSIIELLEQGDYQTTDIVAAILSGYEIMLAAPSYLVIPEG